MQRTNVRRPFSALAGLGLLGALVVPGAAAAAAPAGQPAETSVVALAARSRGEISTTTRSAFTGRSADLRRAGIAGTSRDARTAVRSEPPTYVRNWTFGAEYTDVCDDSAGGPLDLRSAFVEYDTHDILLHAVRTCDVFSDAQASNGDLFTLIFAPGGRVDGFDYLIRIYDASDGEGDWTIEVLRTPSDDPLTWEQTYLGSAFRSDGRTIVAYFPPAAIDDTASFGLGVTSIDSADRTDDLPDLDEDLVPYPDACSRYQFSRRTVQTRPGTHEIAVQAAEAAGFTVVSDRRDLGVFEVERPGRADDDLVLAALSGVAAASPAVYYERSATVTPNDPRVGEQWWLDAIDAPGGWATRTGSGLTIAVIDDGIDGSRVEFGSRVQAGRDTVFDKPLAAGGNSDRGGHGTSVAGIIGAAGNDGHGMAGIDWTAKLVPYRVFDAAGCASEGAIADAVDLAVAGGASVINLSLGGPGTSAIISRAMRDAEAAGVVVVASSGNDATAGNPVTYPAAIGTVIGVGAATREDDASVFSTSGSFVALSAPGGGGTERDADQILTLGERGGYTLISGTSFSSPMVAGAAALYRAARPDATPAQVRVALRETARDAGLLGPDPFHGAGILDLEALLASTVDHLDLTPTAGSSTSGGAIVDHVVGDVDGDGIADVVAAKASTVAILLGDTNDAFVATVSPVAVTAVAIDLADLDLDGDLDLLALQAGPAQVTAYANDGAGVFTLLSTTPVGADPTDLVVDDLVDGDGPDVAVLSAGTDAVDLLTNDGAGAFSASSVALGSVVAPGAGTLVVAGRGPGQGADLVVSTGTAVVVLTPSGAAFTAGTPSALALTDLAAGDVDGDGRDDLVGTDATGRVHARVRGATSAFGASTTSGAPGASVPGRALTAADLDGDGLAEAVVRGDAASATDVWRTRGDGAYTRDLTVTSSAGTVADLSVASFGTPGPREVLTVNASQGAIQVLVAADTRAPQVVADPPPGRYEVVTVALRAIDDDPGATFTYTTDGSVPTASSTEYTGPRSFTTTTLVRWRAVDRSGNVATGSLPYLVNVPTISIDAPGSSREVSSTPFTASLSVPASHETTWSFADGQEATGDTVTHDYLEAGSNNVIAVASFANGGWASATRQIGIGDGGRATRVAGGGRIETAIAVSQQFWATSTSVLIATEGDFPDALAAGALANGLDAPLLLTRSAALPDEVRAEIVRLGARDIWILGGPKAVSPEVEASLRELGAITRLAGASRFATAAAIAEAVGPSPYGEVTLATGDRFPDALSAGALAASLDQLPTLLTQRDVLPGVTFDAIQRMGAIRVYLIGGPGAISVSVEESLRNQGLEVVRLAGTNRFETAAAVADEAMHRYPYEDLALTFATGTNFPDALPAAAAAARLVGPLVLLPPDDLGNTPSIADFLSRYADFLDDGYVIGGPKAVTETVRQQVAAALVVS